MRGLYEKVEEAAAFLRGKGAAPRALVILGTGLGGLGARFEDALRVPYAEVPHFPRSTAPGHAGHLVFGRHGGVPAMVMEGRFHFYEGYSLEQVTLGVRVAKALGARTLLITNATGGLNLAFSEGDIVGFEDHLNLMGASPLRGEQIMSATITSQPDAKGHFGPYGGVFVPETLMTALEELTHAYEAARKDPEFRRELNQLLAEFVGRPTPLYLAERLTAQLGGAKIYLKREDLLHTGAHKINNTIGQLLLARRMKKSRVIAETGAGQHGVAVATVAALFGLR